MVKAGSNFTQRDVGRVAHLCSVAHLLRGPRLNRFNQINANFIHEVTGLGFKSVNLLVRAWERDVQCIAKSNCLKL